MKKMKKLFTLALALLCGMGAMADDYTGHLVLVRGGETIQDQEKVATLTRLDNGQYTLSVDNLTYEAAGMGIGNVVIDSIDAVGNPDQPGVTDLGVAKSIRISSDTISGFPVWVGPRLGAVPIELEGKVAAGQLYFKVKAEASFYGTDFKGDFIFGNVDDVISAGATGIEEAASSAMVRPVATYDLCGRKVSAPREGQVYVVRMSDGTVRKVLR